MSLRRPLAGLSRDSLLLAVASLFSDISTEMLYPLLPVFLTQVLHAGGSVVGLVDGLAQATQNIVQGCSGWWADKQQRRKPIALVGYLLSALSKPLIGLATIWPAVLGARFMDRMGAGIRSAPRDALLAGSVDAAHRGKAFGLESFGDNLGACVGPLLALWLLIGLQIDIRHIFYLALLPGLLAFAMVCLVRERAVAAKATTTLDIPVRGFSNGYWKYLLATAVFSFGNSSNAFLILQTQANGASLQNTILIYAAFNLVAALAAYPAGWLSDHVGRKRVLLAAFAVFFIAYLGFAIATHLAIIAVLFVMYGAYQGIFRAVGKAFAADFVPQRLRASGIGWYSTTVGIMQLIASVIAGVLWDRVSHAAVFWFGAAFALLGSVAMMAWVPRNALNAETATARNS